MKQKNKKSEASKNAETRNHTSLTAVIRISGIVKVKKEIENTLKRLRLGRKYSCVLIDSENKNLKGMLEKVKFYIAYGSIDKKTIVMMLKERAKSVEGDKKPAKFNAEEVAEGLLKGKKLSDFKLKPFFRLHPPRKGIKSKLQYPKGVLGNNKQDINKLIERML